MWLSIVAGVVKAWNGFVKFAGWVRDLGIYFKGRMDAQKAQKEAERKEAEDARLAREQMEDKTDEEVHSILRGDDPS